MGGFRALHYGAPGDPAHDFVALPELCVPLVDLPLVIGHLERICRSEG